MGISLQDLQSQALEAGKAKLEEFRQSNKSSKITVNGILLTVAVMVIIGQGLLHQFSKQEAAEQLTACEATYSKEEKDIIHTMRTLYNSKAQKTVAEYNAKEYAKEATEATKVYNATTDKLELSLSGYLNVSK